MSGRAASRVAWGLWLLSVLAVFAPLLHEVLQEGPSNTGGLADWFTTACFVLSFTTTGAVLASRRPSNPIGWLLLAAGTGYTLGIVSVVLADVSLRWSDWLSSWTWGLGIGIPATFVLLLFPTGALPSRRWRPVAWTAALALAAATLGGMFAPGRISDTTTVNPLGIGGPIGSVLKVFRGAFGLIAIVGLVSVGSLVVRYRRGDGAEREQIKWLIYAGVLLVVAAVGGGIVQSAVRPHDLGVELNNAIISAAFVLVPLAIGFSVLKYRLYDIDVVINKTLVYGALTAVLAAVYVGFVLGLGALVRTLGGNSASPVVVAASTLTAAALFRPLRQRVQAVVDRRFYRRKYDAQHTLETFTGRLRDEVDLDALNADLVRAVVDTMQPSRASVWIREAGR